MFQDYSDGIFYNRVPLFYEEWDDASSMILFECDREVQNICKALKDFDLSEVRSLKEHYGVKTPLELTKKIRSIEGFKGIETPMKKIQDNKYIPDFTSRYFISDFPYGLRIIQQIACLAKVEIPSIEKVLKWFNQIQITEDKGLDFKDYGINSLSDLIKYYKQ